LIFLLVKKEKEKKTNFFVFSLENSGGHQDRDRMVVGFTTTCAISAYAHYSCEFEPYSWQGATGRWFSLGTPVSSNQ
jgi:hypothetical protein